MKARVVDKIVQTLLYEGYILYPYRPSALKNRRRWNFGVLTPKCFSEAQQGTEAWMMQTECLVQQQTGASLSISVRFLQLVSDEAVERDISITDQNLDELTVRPQEFRFHYPANPETLGGSIQLNAELLAPQLFKLKVGIQNLTTVGDVSKTTREEVLPQSLLSTHTILCLKDGEFVSLLEPPNDLSEPAASCRNFGCWPVLVGQPGERDCMLSSPIILYDYPQVATESSGDFYDSTEIDELLALRVLTLTDEEKREMRGGDLRAKQVLERIEGLPTEYFNSAHGAIRELMRLKGDNRD